MSIQHQIMAIGRDPTFWPNIEVDMSTVETFRSTRGRILNLSYELSLSCNLSVSVHLPRYAVATHVIKSIAPSL